MAIDTNSGRYPITIIHERASFFAAVDFAWDEAAWEHAWGTPINVSALEAVFEREHQVNEQTFSTSHGKGGDACNKTDLQDVRPGRGHRDRGRVSVNLFSTKENDA